MSMYSEKEFKLINKLGFGCFIELNVEPISLYKAMAEKAFIDNKQGRDIESLRRCVRAVRECSPWRHTPEFDALIELDDDT